MEVIRAGLEKIRLDIVGMSYSQSQSGAYALILGERSGKRRLPIIIGGFEAQAIAIELEKVKTPRPLTHDLFYSFAEVFGIRMVEVVINKFLDGIFYAILICSDGKKELEIDSRTSDAVALALRFSCPIYTYESIMSTAGIVMDEEQDKSAGSETEPTGEESGSEFSGTSLGELKKQLQNAVQNEEYEKASRIRDEINRRKTEKH